MHTGLVLSAHAHNIENYGRVKVVNNANGTRLAAATKADRLRNVRVGYVLYRALVYYIILVGVLIRTDTIAVTNPSLDWLEPRYFCTLSVYPW